MNDKLAMSRRQFLAGASAAGVIPLIQGSGHLTVRSNAEKFQQAVIKVLQEQDSDTQFHKMREENVSYAFAHIKPETHTELAFVVACGSHSLPMNHFVDEYVRRRNGEESELPDVELAPPEVMGLPNTRRILIFREQIMSLICELRGCKPDSFGSTVPIAYLLNIMRVRRASYEDFHQKIMCSSYRSKFERDTARTFYDAIVYYALHCKSTYVRCSSLAERAYEEALMS